MRPVFDRSKGPRGVGSSSTAWWTLPPCQVTVRPRDRERFWRRKYGLGSAEVMQILVFFNANLLTPFDIRSLAWTLFPPVEYDFFEYKWTQLAVRAVEQNTTLDPGDPRRTVNTDMLLGTGNYARADGQVGFQPLVQEQCQQIGMAALVQTIQLATPQESCVTIVQGVDEPFLRFVGRLTAAVEKQVSDPAARKLMLQLLARSNCNAVCRGIIEALPGDPPMSQMVEACARITPFNHKMAAMATAVQPAVTTVVQPTVATAVQPAITTAMQPAAAAAVQPTWIVPQGVQRQQGGARARRKQGRKAQKPTAVLVFCAGCGRPNHAVDVCKETVHVNGHSLIGSGNVTWSAKARHVPTQMPQPQPELMEICSAGLQPASAVQRVLTSAQPNLS
ncbi:uncharacterized protein LOC134565173 [Prinia subflava]|uniref:uncharacterized protein LOC134565173 n=1 Tax=Prinia subflava TaxID=208062 RepID=UPI002FE3D30A